MNSDDQNTVNASFIKYPYVQRNAPTKDNGEVD